MRKLGCLLIAAVLAVGCGSNDEEGRGDAPVGERYEEAREIWVMPDSFPNLAGVCIDGHLVLVTTREVPPVVIENAERCAR